MGCTGFWLAPDQASQGLGLHARNFDGAFFTWNNHPVLHLIDERPADPAYLRYAAVGTAGLIYPGGINGMNEAGIAVSLHQMSTVNFTPGDGQGRHDVAPYVQQRILREARSLDEAVDIARDRRHFASWTILVSHAPSGRAVRIEMNGHETTASAHERVFGDPYVDKVVPSDPSGCLVQTNHFLADAMRERHDFFSDAHFTKTVGKWIETRARKDRAENLLGNHGDQRPLDTEQALAILADHVDPSAGNTKRSFGRTICKAYSLVSSVMRASPERSAAADEIWFTLGSADGRTPGPHTPLAGFGIDWEGLGVTAKGVIQAATLSPDELTALRHYVEAFRAYERPQQPDGHPFRRQPTEGEMRAVRKIALAALDKAQLAADQAGLVDPAFRYVRARLGHEAALDPDEPDREGLLDAAARDWAELRRMADAPDIQVSDWERARIFLLSAATEAARHGPDSADVERLQQTGLAAVEQVAGASFDGDAVHQDIKAWRKIAAAILDDGAAVDLPGIDFVTVE